VGEAFKRMRAAAFEQQRHRHYQALVAGDLLRIARSSETRVEVRCPLTNAETGLAVGSQCLVRQSDTGECDLVHGNIVVGRLPPEAQSAISASRQAAPNLQGLLPCRVSSMGAFGTVSLELGAEVSDGA
jgi:hypothetical protein